MGYQVFLNYEITVSISESDLNMLFEGNPKYKAKIDEVLGSKNVKDYLEDFYDKLLEYYQDYEGFTEEEIEELLKDIMGIFFLEWKAEILSTAFRDFVEKNKDVNEDNLVKLINEESFLTYFEDFQDSILANLEEKKQESENAGTLLS